MRSIAATIGMDKNVVWIIKISLDSSTIYLKDAGTNLTLEGTTFDSYVIQKDSIDEVFSGIDIENGGSIQQVSNFAFRVVKNNNCTGLSNFIEDLYPATSKPYIVSRKVELGMCWNDATTLSQINWLYEYYVQGYSVEADTILLNCEEKDELSTIELPYYAIQDDTDDGISYFASAAEDSYGQPIPILYGSPCIGGSGLVPTKRLLPLLNIDEAKLFFIVASHACHAVCSDGGDYINSYKEKVKAYLGFYCANQTTSNLVSGTQIQFATNYADYFKRRIYFEYQMVGQINEATNPYNVFTGDLTNYATISPITNNILAIRFKDLSVSDIAGDFSNCKVYVNVYWASATAGQATMQIGVYKGSSTPTYTSNYTTTGTTPATTTVEIERRLPNNIITNMVPVSLEDILISERIVKNVGIAGIRIYSVYLSITEIL